MKVRRSFHAGLVRCGSETGALAAGYTRADGFKRRVIAHMGVQPQSQSESVTECESERVSTAEQQSL